MINSGGVFYYLTNVYESWIPTGGVTFYTEQSALDMAEAYWHSGWYGHNYNNVRFYGVNDDPNQWFPHTVSGTTISDYKIVVGTIGVSGENYGNSVSLGFCFRVTQFYSGGGIVMPSNIKYMNSVPTWGSGNTPTSVPA